MISLFQSDKYENNSARLWAENEAYVRSNIFEYRHFIQWIL